MDGLMMDGMQPMEPQEPEKVIPREPTEPDPSRAALVKEKLDQIAEAKQHWARQFKKMRKDMAFARGKQWSDRADDGRYVANITLRHIQQRTAALYAKNPKTVYRRRPRMDFQMWDGSQEQLAQAQDILSRAMGGTQVGPDGMPVVVQPSSPQEQMWAQMLMQDVQQGKAQREQIDRIGRTLQTVYDYSIQEPRPKFKLQLKQAVRRTLTTGVAFCELGYQRVFDQTPDTDSQIKDASERLAELRRLAADVADDQYDDTSARIEELRIKLEQLQRSKILAAREGLTFGFPEVTSVIVDPECRQLKGFIGANWVAREYCYSPDRVKEVFNVDVSSKYTAYNKDGSKATKKGGGGHAMVYKIYDLVGQIVYYVCEGYPDFLKEPGEPEFVLEQFPPIHVLTFNDVEDDENPYPPSNVELIRFQQVEINRSQEARRQHRIASRPAWISPKGAFGKDDKEKLSTHEDHELLEMEGVKIGEDVRGVLQAKPTQQLDPTLYETDSIFVDALRVSGDQEANFGGTSNSTATESTIAENTRMSTLESNKDDLDDFLSEIAESAGQLLLMNLPLEKAQEIAGVGAVWPKMRPEEIVSQLYLEVASGSTGRPNKALDIANFERLAPFGIQIPEIAPKFFAKKFISLVDEQAEMEDALAAGVPSIVALNGMSQASTGNPESDPNAQGSEGGENAPKQDRPQQGPQAAFPAAA